MNKVVFAILTSTMFISMMGFGFIMPLLPIYAKTMGASSIELGMISAASSFTNLLFLPIMGTLSDRFSRKIFLCTGLLMLSIVMFSFNWATNTTQLIMLRAFQGFAMSMHLPVAQAYLGDLTPPGEEGRWMGYFNAILFAGVGAGPLFGGALNDLFGISWVFLISGGAIMVSFLATFLFLQDQEHKEGRSRPRISFFSLRRSNILKSIIVLQIGSGIMIGVSMTFLPILASVSLGLSTTLIGIILAMRTPVSMLQTFSGRFADTHNRKVQIASGTLVAAFSMVAITLCSNFWQLLLAQSMLSFGVVLYQPAASAYVVEEGRSFGMGATMSLFLMAMQAGASVGPIAIGRVIDIYSLSTGFKSGALFNILGLGFFLYMMRRIPGRKQPVTVQV